MKILSILTFVLLTATLGIGQTKFPPLNPVECDEGIKLPIINGFAFDFNDVKVRQLMIQANPGLESRITPVMFSRTQVLVKLYPGKDVLCFPFETLETKASIKEKVNLQVQILEEGKFRVANAAPRPVYVLAVIALLIFFIWELKKLSR